MQFLIIANGPDKGRLFKLPEDAAAPLTIGRHNTTMLISDSAACP